MARAKEPADAVPTEAAPFGVSREGDGFADIVTAAGPGGGPHIKVFDGETGAESASFFAFAPGFTGGVNVAAGDVNGDGRADIVAGAGPGGNGHVKVFDGQSYGVIASFFAFGAGFAGGVNVASGDVNGDGNDDIIVGAGAGGGPHVRVFDGGTGGLLHSFFAYDPGFTGGVFVSAGDFDSDGRADIATGTETGSSHVKVFDGGSLDPLASFFAFGPSFTGGVSIGGGDVNGDGLADLVTGKASGAPQVRVFSGPGLTQTASFLAFDPGFTGGVRVAAGDIDSEGGSEIVVGAASGSSHVKVFDGLTSAELDSFFAYSGFTGGVFVAGGDVEGAPHTVMGTSGNDVIHGDDESVSVPPGYNEVTFPGGGNQVIVGGAGNDLIHGKDGVDQAVYNAQLQNVLWGDYFGTASLDTPTEGFDFFDHIEIFRFSDGEIQQSQEGHPRWTTVRMPGGSNSFRVRTTGEEGVTTVAVNQANPADPAFNDTMLIQDVGRLELVLGGGGNTVSLEVDGTDTGLDSLVLHGAGGPDDTFNVEITDPAVEEVVVEPLDDFFMALNVGIKTHLFEGFEELEISAPDIGRFIARGHIHSLAKDTLIWNAGDGDTLMDASGVLSNHRVVMNAAGGADTLLAGAGEDVLNAGSGNDELDGGGRQDQLDGDTGHDQIVGGAGNDKLNGGQGADTLVGGTGKDKLLGGANSDRLRGEAGPDTFAFTKTTDSTAAAWDRILDLASEDKIDLSKIDADTGAGGNQAFHIVGAFSGDAGELIRVYAAGQDRTYFRADTDGDGTADVVVAADGNHTSFTNFVL